MSDISQTNFKEAPQVDWEGYGKSAWAPPPPARDAAGNSIIYYGVAEPVLDEADKDGYMQYLLDPVKIVKSGAADGYTLRFVRASLNPYKDKNGNPKKGNPNKLADYLRACGLSAKPQQNSEYQAAVRMTINKPFPFILDWEAYNKDNQEKVNGFLNFPADPERPGSRKAILHAGDTIALTDSKGVPNGQFYTVKSEVLFANARLKFFQDPSRSRG